MNHSKSFRFKHFEVQHNRCAMKVNTDGVLLGAWANVTGVSKALDVGTGCGVIALMLVQRGVNKVEAIELDNNAAVQAAENFAASTWAKNLCAHHVALQHYQPSEPYDLIVSNPPYFENGLKTPIANRNLARHNDTLPLSDLMAFASTHLASRGLLSIVIPTNMENKALAAANKCGLYAATCCYVSGRVGGEIKRVLVSFGREEVNPLVTDIAIETSPLQYTAAFKQLTKDFYLAF